MHVHNGFEYVQEWLLLKQILESFTNHSLYQHHKPLR